MLQTAFPLSHSVTRTYTSQQIKLGHAVALNLLRLKSPNQLRFSPSGKKAIETAKLIVLMGIAAQAKFEHLYPGGKLDTSARGQELSEQAYERFAECVKLIDEYPRAENDAFRAKLDFIYYWLIGVAKNRPKNFLKMFNPQGATLSKRDLKALAAPHIRELSDLNENNHPTLFYVAKYLLSCATTRLPFNIQIPF